MWNVLACVSNLNLLKNVILLKHGVCRASKLPFSQFQNASFSAAVH